MSSSLVTSGGALEGFIWELKLTIGAASLVLVAAILVSFAASDSELEKGDGLEACSAGSSSIPAALFYW
jgi:hypothetical protein